jgi:hypothetical protein
MKKLLFGTLLLALVIAGPISSVMAAGGRMDVGVSVPLPPPLMFPAPPQLVVIPETYVYAVPDVDVDIFFYGGWWWRPWEGRWYRSQRYDSGWGHYRGTPSFYGHVPSGWRNDYKQGRWKGHQWDRRKVPHQQAQKNWKGWERDKHWEKQNNWGVRGLKKPSKQPQQQYQGDQRRQQDNRDRDKRDRDRRDRR